MVQVEVFLPSESQRLSATQVEVGVPTGYHCAVLANMRRPKRKRRQSQTPLTLSPRRVEEPDAAAAEGEGEAVLSLDADSFDDAVAKHPFVVALFYAPWCRQSKKLAPEVKASFYDPGRPLPLHAANEFDVAALEKFIDTSSTPRVVTLDKSPDNHSYLLKFYESSAPKAMLFLNYSAGTFDSFKSTYYAAAMYFKDKEIKFLIGDTEASQGALQYFGPKKDQAPLILIRHGESMFLKNHIEADQIVSWLKEYFDGKLTPFKKSQPIPEVNNEPVKVVVADSLHDVVFKSGKNVLIEFYAPWCRDCKKLAPILEEAATTLQSDDEVVVAKMDATANDVPSEFDGCQVYPAMYLVTASGKVTAYHGGRAANEIVDFVKNKETTQPPLPSP